MKKWRKSIFGVIAFASFFLVLGGVGAMETYRISFEQGVMQMFGFMVICGICTYLAGGFTERRED